MRRTSLQIAAIALLAAAAPLAWADADITAAVFDNSVNAGVNNAVILQYTFSGIDIANCTGATLELRMNGVVVHSGPAVPLNGAFVMAVDLSAAELSFPNIRSTGSTSVAVEAFFGAGCDDTPGADIVNTTLNIIPQTPTISSLGVTTIPAGNGNSAITITGNFLYDDTQLEVQTPAGTQTLTRTNNTTITSNLTSASYTIPAALLLTPGATSVRAASDPSVFSSAFTGLSIVAPAITSLSPNPIPIGTASTVTITGTNFVSGAQVLYTPPGGVQAAISTNFISSNSITFNVSAAQAAAAGQATVAVRNAAGATVSGNSTITLEAPPPMVSSITPDQVTPGSAAFQLTVNGSGFLTGATVYWNAGGSPTALGTSFISSTQLAAIVPAALVSSAGAVLVSVGNIGSAQSTPVPLTVGTLTPPSITTLNPNTATAGGPGFTLAINGLNLAAGASVQWSIGGATTSLTTSFVSSTQLTATVPSALIATAGVASISVTQSGGTSNIVTMNVTGAAPLVTSVTPDRVAPGSADFQLTINGSGFVSGLQVNWNLAGAQTQLSPTFVSATQIITLVPANLVTAERSVLISVTNPGGAVSNGFPFQVSATTANPPTLMTINPNTRDAGSGSFALIANGANFDSGTQVRWTTQAGTQVLTTGFISTGQLQALVPASLVLTPGTVLVSVVNLDGVASPSLPLTIVSGTAPTLTTLNPDRVTVGSAAFQLRANGTNFVPGSTLQWNNGATTQPLTTSFTSSTEVTAVVPANLIATQGVALVSVLSPGGIVSNAISMPIAGVSGVTPVINPAGLSPDTVTAGSAPFQLSITGTSFSPGAQVQWTTQAGRVSLTTGFGSSTALTALVPAELVRTQGIALISILNVDGATSNSVVFSIPAGTAPGITSVTPTSLTVGAAAQLTVQGTGFSQDSIVQWNTGTTTVPLSTGFVSATQLTVVVPATLTAAPAVALITVQNPGSVISNAVTVPISPESGLTPAVNTTGGLAPSSTTAGGSSFQMTVTGTNFVSGSQVQWTTQTGTTALTTGFVSATQLSALVPSNLITSPGNVLVSVLNPGGAISNSVSMGLTSGQAPTINTTGGLTPDRATVGGPSFQLTVSGTNFTAGSQVQWSGTGGSLTLTTGFVNATQLTAVVPANLIAAVGSAIVTVVNPGSTQSNAVSFTVANVTGESPRADTINPNRRPAGSGQFQLAITGANFVNGSVVNWNPGNGPQPLATGFVSATQLTALVPAGLTANAGVALITVVNPGNASSNSITFEIENSAGASPPTVAANNGLQPGDATAGSAAFTMVVNGTSFANGSIVQWNAGTGPQNLVTGFVSATQLTALVPANLITTPGAVFVTVLNPGGLSSNAATFTVKPPAGNVPVINDSGGLNPGSAPSTSASFQLTITGTNFVNGAVVEWTSGGGVTPLATGFNSATQLTAIVPASLITTQGVAFIRVVNPGGASSNAATFTIQAASGNVPTITSSGGLNPAAASVGTSGFQLTVSGSNFVNGSIVQWNPGGGPQALTTGFVTPSTLTALVPSSFLTAPGTVFITVLNPGGASSNSVSFTIGGASPIITGLGQTTIPAGFGPLTLAVNGQNFGTGATVRWATQNLPTTSNGANQLIASVTGNLTNGVGTFDITVSSAAGTSNAVQISVAPAQVTLLSPRTAPVGSPPFSLSVGGSNFVSGSQVLFGTTPLTTTYVSPTELSAQVTSVLLASAGNINVLVQNPGGSQSNATAFAIGAAPNIAGIAPASASAGSQAVTITVTGTNFANGDVVHWNGSPLSTTFVSNTQLTARVGAELLAQAGAVNVSVLGRTSSNVVLFTIGGPTVTTLLPATAAAGATTLQLKVTGTGFVTGTAVLWNNTLLPTSLNSATELTAVVEASLLANPGIAFVGVSSPGGARSERMSFTIEGPTLTQLSPTTITAGGPTFNITVTGTNFVNGATVMWDATSLPTTFGSGTQLTAQVAANLIQSAATITVLVRNPGGAQTSSRPFTISAPPAATVTGLNPPNAVAGSAAFQLTIVGTNFMQGAVVQWNGQPLPTSFTNATQLSALVDTAMIAAAGTANVSVLNPGSPVSESTRFTINGPSITTLSPNNVAAASLPFEMTITGLNFLPGSVIEWNGLAQPTAFTSATQLRATIPTELIRTAASVSVTIRNPGGAVSPAATFTVGPFTLAIDTTSMRDAIVGRSYSETIVARGGTPPYTYSLAGALPDGITLEPAIGSISGTPLAPGTVNFTLTVTDGERRTVTRPFTLRTAPALTITTAAALPNVLVGGSFSATMTAAGGTPPYIWSSPNQLPPGLSLNGTTGELAGNPTTAGTYRFQLRCRDSRQQDEPRDFVVIVLPGVPGFTIGGVSESMQPALQPRIEISIAQPYPVELQGVLNMTYSSDVGGDDSSVQFSTGGRRVTFTIPPGSTTAMYGEIEELSMGTGTLASTITLRSTLTAGTLIVTPVPVPVRTIRIARAVPVLTSVTFTRGDTGVIVTMTGFSTTREIQRGTFRFNPRPGSNITSSEVTSQLANLFQQWYQGTGTAAVGSQFRLSMPFNVSGRVDAIESVTVTLTNNQGASQAVTADLQ